MPPRPPPSCRSRGACQPEADAAAEVEMPAERGGGGGSNGRGGGEARRRHGRRGRGRGRLSSCVALRAARGNPSPLVWEWRESNRDIEVSSTCLTFEPGLSTFLFIYLFSYKFSVISSVC